MNVPKERAQQSGAASSAAADLISCPTCQHDAPATFRFCAECGTRLPFFRPQQIIDQKYQVVRLVSQDNDSDVYEIRRLHDNASQAPGSQLSMSPDRAAAAVPAAVMPCPTCQHDAPASFRFCPECGTRLPFLRPQQIIDQRAHALCSGAYALEVSAADLVELVGVVLVERLAESIDRAEWRA